MWKVVIDHGTHKDFFRVHSEWVAKYICDEYGFKARLRGDMKTKFYIEKVVINVKGIHAENL